MKSTVTLRVLKNYTAIDLQRTPAEEIAFYNKVKLPMSIDRLLCYYYRKIKCFATELRERIYVEHSIVKVQYGY